MLKNIFLVITLLLVAVTSACATTSSPLQYSTVEVCKNLALLNKSIEELKAEENYDNSNELLAQVDVVRRNLNNAVQSLANLTQVNADSFSQATSDLAEAASKVPDDATVQETITILQPQLDAVSKEIQDIQNGLKCAP